MLCIPPRHQYTQKHQSHTPKTERNDYMNPNQALFDFIHASPTAYHTVAHIASVLQKDGYTPLSENEKWEVTPGGRYFVTRNGSSLIAFSVPEKELRGFMPAAAHCDSPAFKIKENPELCDEWYVRLSTEKYGGMLCASWMDRPLSVAGRVCLRTPEGMAVKTVDLEEPVAIIPHVAIHMNRAANENAKYDPAVDMLPVFGTAAHKGGLLAQIAERVGVPVCDILSHDLFLYNPQPGVTYNGLIAAPRLDDLECVFAALSAFRRAKVGESMPLLCVFDNEEVGSSTKQGADSSFFSDTLQRVCHALGIGAEGCARLLADSLMLSCDNAHARHPNHPEFSDRNHTSVLNGGVVVKYNANQRYTSDAVSAGLFKLLCEHAHVPVQYYANRADMPGGSTLGNIANTHVSLNTLDIGLAQLAMHSAFETAGADDLAYMTEALTCFFSASVRQNADGTYRLLF